MRSAGWPTRTWPVADWPAEASAALSAVVRPAFDDPAVVEHLGATTAVAVVHRGRLVLERHGAADGPATTYPSWSMAKSVLHAVTGLLVGDGSVTLDDAVVHPAAPVPAGDAPTVRDLLEMRDGLQWSENYGPEGISDVQQMLWGDGRDDVARYVGTRPQAHRPGAVYGYSSGTSNLLSWHLGQVLQAQGDTMADFLRRRLFDPLGMASATPKFDAAGTWIASTYCFATVQDLLRFGLLYLRDGMWEHGRLLPAGWVDNARTGQPDVVDEDGWGYAHHWWTLPARRGPFFANGYAGQFLFLVPEHDLTVLRLGTSPPGSAPQVLRFVGDVADAAVAAAPGTPGSVRPDDR